MKCRTRGILVGYQGEEGAEGMPPPPEREPDAQGYDHLAEERASGCLRS